jgi:hypothetical protein
MPSRVKKLSKRRILRKTKNARVKHLSKMRGGASASAASAASATSDKCFDEMDSNLIQLGVPIEKYLSDKPYESGLMYSDHAPIIYNFANAPEPIKNPCLSIITWNVCAWGNQLHIDDKGKKSYNHKFNMQAKETIKDYKLRLVKLVEAMADLLDNNPPKGNNHPFLFCQELPFISLSNQQIDIELREYFEETLKKKSLELLCDSDTQNEYGLIVKKGSMS